MRPTCPTLNCPKYRACIAGQCRCMASDLVAAAVAVGGAVRCIRPRSRIVSPQNRRCRRGLRRRDSHPGPSTLPSRVSRSRLRGLPERMRTCSNSRELTDWPSQCSLRGMGLVSETDLFRGCDSAGRHSRIRFRSLENKRRTSPSHWWLLKAFLGRRDSICQLSQDGRTR